MTRVQDRGVETKPLKPAAKEAKVSFVKPRKDLEWKPENGTLLELAEAHGIDAEFNCCGGTCGTCRTRIVEGTVSYASEPAFHVEDDEALICCAVPAVDSQESLKLDL